MSVMKRTSAKNFPLSEATSERYFAYVGQVKFTFQKYSSWKRKMKEGTHMVLDIFLPRGPQGT